MAWLLVLALLAVGGAGFGRWLTHPGGILATSTSGQTVWQDSDSHLHWSAGWTTVHTSSASGGDLHVGSAAGASVTVVYYGSYVRLLAPTGRGNGTMQVTLDGVTTAVSTRASVYHAQQVVFAAGPAGRRHVLTIRVLGTVGHPFISIDALVISPVRAAVGPQHQPPPPTTHPSSGNFVATNGNDANPGTQAAPWRTLQKAADTATGNVWIRGGTYTSFTLRRNGLTFSSYPGETARISNSSAKDMVYIYQVNGAVFEHLSIQGGIQIGGSGIDVASSSNVVINNNVIDSTVSTNKGFGIRTWNSTDVTIENNDISEQAAGIQISYTATGDAILDNLIHDNNRMIVNTISPTNDDHGANGVIFLKTTGNTLASGNELWGNRAPSYDYGYDGSAFEIYGASDVTITNNTMWNNKNVLETGTDGLPCNNLTFTRNVAWSATTVAGYARGVLIACASNSLFAFNTLDGFDISDISIVYNAGYIYQGSESGLKVVDNILISNGAPIYHLETPPSGVTVDRNVVWNRTGGALVWDKTYNGTTSWDTFRSWYGYESHGMNADPQIVSQSARDYHLQTTSPAINAGSVISGVSSSYLGTAPDIGRFEIR